MYVEVNTANDLCGQVYAATRRFPLVQPAALDALHMMHSSRVPKLCLRYKSTKFLIVGKTTCGQF